MLDNGVLSAHTYQVPKIRCLSTSLRQSFAYGNSDELQMKLLSNNFFVENSINRARVRLLEVNF